MKKSFLLYSFVVGAFLSSVHAQNFWQPITDPCWSYTNAMIVAKNGNIIASGCNPPRYSTNDGSSWLFSNGFVDSYFNRFAMNSTGTIFGVSPFGVWKSVDNGVNWERTDTDLGNIMVDDIAINSNDQLFILTRGNVLRSLNNGMSWDTVCADYTYPPAVSIAINSSNTIFIGTEYFSTGGQIYSSTDNAENWTSLAGSIFTNTAIKIIKIYNNEIYVGTSSMGMYRSLDNGLTWTNINSGMDGDGNYISDFIFDSKGRIFVSVDYIGVFASSDKGNSWTNISSGLLTAGTTVRTPESLTVNSSDFLFAGTSEFGTYRSSTSTSSKTDLPAKDISITSYPNPAKHAITIEISANTPPEHWTLTIFDCVGKEVQQNYINSYTSPIELNDLSQGIYYYKLQNGHDILGSGKIIID